MQDALVGYHMALVRVLSWKIERTVWTNEFHKDKSILVNDQGDLIWYLRHTINRQMRKGPQPED